eukprot:6200336-Pleurochrysis_carterae.AAC.2
MCALVLAPARFPTRAAVQATVGVATCLAARCGCVRSGALGCHSCGSVRLVESAVSVGCKEGLSKAVRRSSVHAKQRRRWRKRVRALSLPQAPTVVSHERGGVRKVAAVVESGPHGDAAAQVAVRMQHRQVGAACTRWRRQARHRRRKRKGVQECVCQGRARGRVNSGAATTEDADQKETVCESNNASAPKWSHFMVERTLKQAEECQSERRCKPRQAQSTNVPT